MCGQPLSAGPWTSDLFPVQENNCTFFSPLLVWDTWHHFLNKPKSEQERLSSGSSRRPSRWPCGWEVQRTPPFLERGGTYTVNAVHAVHGSAPAWVCTGEKTWARPGGPRGTPSPLPLSAQYGGPGPCRLQVRGSCALASDGLRRWSLGGAQRAGGWGAQLWLLLPLFR